MGAATTSKARTVVGVSFKDHELAELDRQRARLAASAGSKRKLRKRKFPRGTALKLIWECHSDDAVGAVVQQRIDTADRESSPVAAAQPLVDGLAELTAAWQARAHQRQAIGVHTNQIAKLSNVERFLTRDGGQVTDETAQTLALALQGVKRSLDEQAAAEREDERLVAAVRAGLEQLRAIP